MNELLKLISDNSSYIICHTNNNEIQEDEQRNIHIELNN